MRERILQVFVYLHTTLFRKVCILTTFAFLLTTSNLLSQPLNEDCLGAQFLDITPGVACPLPSTIFATTFTGIDNTGAVEGFPALPCAPLPVNSADVWFTFIAPTPALEFEMDGLAQNNLILYEGVDCDNLSAIFCGTLGGATSHLQQNMTVGNTYFIEVFGGDLSDVGPITLTITSYDTPESCATACDIGPIIPGNACPFTAPTASNFSVSNLGAPNNGTGACGATTATSDVWLSFIAPFGATSLTVQAAGLANTNFIAYTGACGSLANVGCSEGGTPEVITNIIGGQVYYLQLFGGDESDQGTINVSITANALPEDCLNACSLGQLVPGSPCPPPTSTGNNSFNLTNIGAFPMPNYPTHPDCIPPGGVAADVWFSFIPTSNQIEASITGLGTGIGAIYSGGCNSLVPEGCFIGNGTLDVTPNVQYFIQVSGGDISDQNDFTLVLNSSYNCETCATNFSINQSPGSNNGKYADGDEVIFCWTLSQWDVSQGINWVHGVVPQLGPGWDFGSLTPVDAAGNPTGGAINTCGTAGGAWGWYPGWTGGTAGNGTASFGPGWAFEHTGQGSTPGNSPADPGDNWGDACSNAGFLPVPLQFCWQVSVADCPPNVGGDDLSVSVLVYSDYESGDWVQAGCTGGNDDDAIPMGDYTAVCCNDPEPIVVVTPESCQGACDGSVTATSTATAGSPRTFVWFQNGVEVFVDGPQTTGVSTLSGLCPGTYSVRENDPTSFCGVNGPLAVVDPGSPAPSVTFASTNTCFDPLAGPPQVTLNYNAGTAPYTINYTEAGIPNTIVLATGQPFPLATIPTIPTLITITSITDINGCQSNVPSSILLSPGPSVNITPFSPEFCENDMITISANGSGGAGGLSYQWSDSNGGFYFGQNVDVTTPGAYTVTVTDANFCTTTEVINVNQTPAPLAAPSAANFSTCADEDILLFGSSATPGNVLQYRWTGPFGYESFEQNPTIPAGSLAVGLAYQYCLEVTVDNGNGLPCQSLPECVNVDIKPVPDAMINYVTNCPDQPLVIELFGTTFTTGNSGNVQSFYWTGPLGYESFEQNPIDATESGLYTLEITIDGCVSTQVFEIIDVPEIPTALIGANGTLGLVSVNYCQGEPTQLNADFSVLSNFPNSVSYAWSGPGGYSSTAQNPTDITESGLYSVVVTADYGNGTMCPSTNVAFIAVSIAPSLPPNLAPVGPLCASDAPVALDPTQSTITGAWSGTGVSGGQFDPTGLSGDITLTFTPDPNQCADVATQDVTVVAPATINITDPGNLCTDNNGLQTLAVTPAGGTWTGDVAPNGSFTPSGLGAGNYTATYTFTDPIANCVTTDQINFNVSALPTVSIDAVGGFCEADNTLQTLAANPAGGAWSGDVAANGSFTPSSLGAGTGYTATYTYTDPTTQCTSSDQVTFAVESTPSIAITDPGELCIDDNASQTLAANPPGGTWTGDVAANGSFTPSALGDGSFTATYTYTDPSGICTNSGQINFSVNALPSVSATDPGSFCIDNNASQSLSGSPFGGTWTGDVAANGSFTPSALGAGAYTATYTYTDPNTQCVNTAQVNFDVEALPTVNINAPGSYCASDNSNQSLIASPTGGTWTGDVATNGSFTPSSLGNGNFTATYTFMDPTTQCVNTDQVNFVIEAIPTIVIDAVGDLCADDNGNQQLTASPAGGTWTGDVATDGSFTPSALGDGNFNATYTYTDASG
ncbi:MAG: hypothetical protein AAF985_10670, partial [Bacteroidota bacterium]